MQVFDTWYLDDDGNVRDIAARPPDPPPPPDYVADARDKIAAELDEPSAHSVRQLLASRALADAALPDALHGQLRDAMIAFIAASAAVAAAGQALAALGPRQYRAGSAAHGDTVEVERVAPGMYRRAHRSDAPTAEAWAALAIGGRMVHGNLAKSILDAGWGYLVQRLTHKAASAGRVVVLVDPRYTSKTCSGCGALFAGLTLKDRWVNCACGLSLDRDHNAAINILNRGGQLRWSSSSPVGGLGQEAAPR